MHKSFLVLLACAISSCGDAGTSPGDQTLGPLVFEIEYINFAWGFTYLGKALFEDRNLYSYNPGAEGIKVLYHEDEQYTASELASKYRHRRVVLGTLSADTLLYMGQLVSGVRVGDNSDTTMSGADQGTVVYSVYRFRADESRYERVTLRVEGDWAFHNRSEGAITLVELMRRL
jgi:hypothetical protein